MNPIASMLGPEGFGSYEVDWSTPEPTFTRISKPPDLLLVPGFIDIHIHGGFGIDFMSASDSDLKVLATKLEAEGYEAFFPTTITASPEAILRAISKLPEDPIMPGFHLEGPFISSEYPGAQPPGGIAPVPIVDSEWDPILDHPRLKIVTLAPEIPNAVQLILRLRARGVLVGMGHTNATFSEARSGFEHGATHTTHTFNAMRGLHHREAGTVGYSLANSDLAAELIYDRHHVCKDAASLLLKNKSPDAVIAVSDGTQATGIPPGQIIDMWGHSCVTSSGTVRLADTGALAGSAITLLDAFRNLASDFGEETAIRCCSLNPRALLGMKDGPRVYLEFDRYLQLTGRRIQGT